MHCRLNNDTFFQNIVAKKFFFTVCVLACNAVVVQFPYQIFTCGLEKRVSTNESLVKGVVKSASDGAAKVLQLESVNFKKINLSNVLMKLKKQHCLII